MRREEKEREGRREEKKRKAIQYSKRGQGGSRNSKYSPRLICFNFEKGDTLVIDEGDVGEEVEAEQSYTLCRVGDVGGGEGTGGRGGGDGLLPAALWIGSVHVVSFVSFVLHVRTWDVMTIACKVHGTFFPPKNLNI